MFGFFKDKIKQAVSRITAKADKEISEPEEQKIKEPVVEKQVEKKQKKQIKKKESIKQKKSPEQKEIQESEEPVVEKQVEKKGFFQRITEKVTTTKISSAKFEELFSELELALLENNVALEVIDKIKTDLSKELVDNPIKRGSIHEIIQKTLKNTLKEILETPELNLKDLVKNKIDKPLVLLFLGYNGAGKSLTVSKVGQYLKKNKISSILAAGDTFRAAGATQLEEYGKRIGIKVISQKQGSDSCSVIYDAISSAKSRNIDVVLGDTAGRIHSNKDLMRELQKIVRVAKPDLKILVIDALTGSDVVPQVEEFNKEIGIDALIITKVDVYEKGGSILSAAYLLKKPILFLGIGQADDDLKEYSSELVLKNLGF